MIDAFNRRDIEAMLEQADENFEYDWTRSLGLYADVYRGPEGFKRFVDEQWSMFDDFRARSPRVDPARESRGRAVRPCTPAAATGVPVSANSAHLYTFEDGRIVRVAMYQERGEALAAAVH